MRPKAEWAIDSEPIQARGIVFNYLFGASPQDRLKGSLPFQMPAVQATWPFG